MSAYTAQMSRRVYRTLRRKAAAALAAGYSVIIDAVSLKPAERRSFVAVAEAAGVPFSGLWLAAPAAAMDRRLRTRRQDASDASPEVLAQQLRQDPGTVDWVRIDAGTGRADCLSESKRIIGIK
jgi:predicted kinase